QRMITPESLNEVARAQARFNKASAAYTRALESVNKSTASPAFFDPDVMDARAQLYSAQKISKEINKRVAKAQGKGAIRQDPVAKEAMKNAREAKKLYDQTLRAAKVHYADAQPV